MSRVQLEIVVRSIRHICQITGRGKGTIYDYIDQGAPIYKVDGVYQMDLAEFHRWYFDIKPRAQNRKPEDWMMRLLKSELSRKNIRIAELEAQLNIKA